MGWGNHRLGSKSHTTMQQAQDNPDIDFIVTYGHKPVVSSTGWGSAHGYSPVFSPI